MKLRTTKRRRASGGTSHRLQVVTPGRPARVIAHLCTVRDDDTDTDKAHAILGALVASRLDADDRLAIWREAVARFGVSRLAAIAAVGRASKGVDVARRLVEQAP
jgi:hypothetical protein